MIYSKTLRLTSVRANPDDDDDDDDDHHHHHHEEEQCMVSYSMVSDIISM